MYYEIIDLYFNEAFVGIEKENLKSVFWAPEFGSVYGSPKWSEYVTGLVIFLCS